MCLVKKRRGRDITTITPNAPSSHMDRWTYLSGSVACSMLPVHAVCRLSFLLGDYFGKGFSFLSASLKPSALCMLSSQSLFFRWKSSSVGLIGGCKLTMKGHSFEANILRYLPGKLSLRTVRWICDIGTTLWWLDFFRNTFLNWIHYFVRTAR